MFLYSARVQFRKFLKNCLKFTVVLFVHTTLAKTLFLGNVSLCLLSKAHCLVSVCLCLVAICLMIVLCSTTAISEFLGGIELLNFIAFFLRNLASKISQSLSIEELIFSHA